MTPPKLTEEQIGILQNWKNFIPPSFYNIQLIQIIEKILLLKDLESEIKVAEAVKKERERCIKIFRETDLEYFEGTKDTLENWFGEEWWERLEKSLNPEPPK